MKYAIALVSVVILCLVIDQVALADDINPPTWRGQESTTLQIWEFNYDADPDGSGPYDYAPDGSAGDGLAPLAGTHAVVIPGDPTWKEVDDVHGTDRVGIWGMSGYIDVVVDNYDEPNDYKWVWLQITWAPDMVGYSSAPMFTNMNPLADPAWPVTLTDEVDWGDGWFTSTYEWRIYPNPVEEAFTISYDSSGGGTATIVDQLVIDTWCVPEPATLGLLIIGGVALLKRRSQKE